MNTMFWEMGIFNIALVLMIFFQIYEDRKKYYDCRLFGRVLLASAAILAVDTVGWLIDGRPLWGQIWITEIIDGLDLILTTLVCWCWVQYAIYIANGKKQLIRRWYKDFATILLLSQIVIVSLSQVLGIYFYIDEMGVYHRTTGYLVHTLISILMLGYSSLVCIWAARKHSQKQNGRQEEKESLFVATIILFPIIGNIFQFFVYGYPTVWLCMVFMVFSVYIHIQNRRINEERQEQNRMLKQALLEAQNASAAKTEFFSRMSHDMRTPMNGILGLAHLSLEEQNPEVLRENIGKMKSTGEYMLGLINDTLTFQKIESGKMVLEPEVVSVRDLLESICSMVQETAREKGVEFKIINRNVNVENYLKVDPIRVKQIFINLLSNAIKFTPAGGTVELEMEVLSTDGLFFHDKITVTDTGIGMSSDFLENGIFQPFSQEYNGITAKTSGTGLGLSISKQLVELMGGTISVESEQGSGSRFEVLVDFEHVEEDVIEKRTEADTEQKEHIEQMLCNKNVLLAEDHPLNAEIAKRLLEKMQCNVTWATDGQECVDKFSDSEMDYYDIILMDIRMPVMDGLEATRQIRALDRPDAAVIPIMAMTANAYEEDKKKSEAVGMNAHLAKPIEPQKMYETIARLLSLRDE